MALQATLSLAGKYYDVRDLDYSIEKPVGANLKPNAPAEGGLITFTILSPMDGNLAFHEWVTSNSEMKSGEFKLPLTHGIEHFEKRIIFEKALCVGLQEYYSAGSSNASQMYMRIKIAASIIKFSDTVKFTNKNLPE